MKLITVKSVPSRKEIRSHIINAAKPVKMSDNFWKCIDVWLDRHKPRKGQVLNLGNNQKYFGTSSIRAGLRYKVYAVSQWYYWTFKIDKEGIVTLDKF